MLVDRRTILYGNLTLRVYRRYYLGCVLLPRRQEARARAVLCFYRVRLRVMIAGMPVGSLTYNSSALQFTVTEMVPYYYNNSIAVLEL